VWHIHFSRRRFVILSLQVIAIVPQLTKNEVSMTSRLGVFLLLQCFRRNTEFPAHRAKARADFSFSGFCVFARQGGEAK
jgi:hypothetical protein